MVKFFENFIVYIDSAVLLFIFLHSDKLESPVIPH